MKLKEHKVDVQLHTAQTKQYLYAWFLIIDINVVNYLYDSLLLNSMEYHGEHCTVPAVVVDSAYNILTP